ncbi:hypothetical protein Ctha_1036 [Chloroherpeton thalassium ATCC 35110]|uniref:Uncharacterized protein n=1 Tax=Chloroherpeton thalassium (strain ATCC 35110 / GB-78) TaxID=517418 RepID=B3QXX2_CHLT3|nr:hypothetical protein Ctha_1036 [Chloroherpeton thalassium ATCC 35110]
MSVSISNHLDRLALLKQAYILVGKFMLLHIGRKFQDKAFRNSNSRDDGFEIFLHFSRNKCRDMNENYILACFSFEEAFFRTEAVAIS